MKNQFTFNLFTLLAVLFLVVFVIVLPRVAIAFSTLHFTPPTQITLQMYTLNPVNGAIAGSSCQVDDKRYGCTFIPNNDSYKYPFSDDVITIGIGNHTQNSIQQGYLQNVVPQELDPGHAASSVRAQAIAARTYAYYQIEQFGTLNNSASKFQAYIPYRYAVLSSAQKAVIDQAVAGQAYMSLPGSTDPILAFFGADNDTWTVEREGFTYLKSIFDPISSSQGNTQNPNGGMGQKGAGRWGAGRTSEYPGQGNRWSVRWDTAEQILAHYYTEIKFIGLASNLSNDYRFNVLDIEGLPEQLNLRPGEATPPRNLVLQNSGPFHWNVVQASQGSTNCLASSPLTRLSYHLYKADNSALACEAHLGVNSACFGIERYALCQSNSTQVQPGVIIGVPNVRIRIPSVVPPGTYKVRFDLEIVGTEWVSGLPGANHWPAQDIEVIVEDEGGGGDQGSVSINHPPAVFTNDDWRRLGQQFGFSWNPIGGANYFDIEYRSREFFISQWNNWVTQYNGQSLHNIPQSFVKTPINCNQDRHEYEFRVRGQIGPAGSEGPWKYTTTQLRILPFLSVNNVVNGYTAFFESDPLIQTKMADLYVVNKGEELYNGR
jgi:Stage II sporulation protein